MEKNCNNCIHVYDGSLTGPCNGCHNYGNWSNEAIIKKTTKVQSSEEIRKAAEKNSSLLHEAEKLINNDRQKQYGNPVENYEKIADIFNKITDNLISASDAALFMVILKLVRNGYKYKEDNLIDAAAYLEIIRRIENV